MEKKEKILNEKHIINEYKKFIKSKIENGTLTLNTTYTEFSDENEDKEIFKLTPELERKFIFDEVKLRLKKIYEEHKQQKEINYINFIEKNFPVNLITNKTKDDEIKNILKKQPEYLSIASKTERNKLINDYLTKVKKLKQYSNNINDNLSSLENNYNKIQFSNLLNMKIKTEISYEEAMNRLKKEEEYNLLKEEEKIEIYKDFLFNLREKHKEEYLKLLEEKIGYDQDLNWADVQHLLQSDIRFRNVQEKERENIFTKYHENIYNRILNDFESLVNERSDLINKDTKLDGKEYDNLINILKNDDRCIRIEKFPDKRDKIIRNKVKEMRFKFNQENNKKKKNTFFNGKKRDRDLNQPWEKGYYNFRLLNNFIYLLN